MSATECLSVYALMLLPEGTSLRKRDLPEGTRVATIKVSPNTFATVPEAWEGMALQLARYLRDRPE